MWINYLKVAWRHLFQNKITSTINIFGLALAIATALLIGLYVKYQLDFDKWETTDDAIYRVYRHWDRAEGGWVYSPGNLAPALINEIPEILTATHITADQENLLSVGKKKIYVEKSIFVDSNFFETIPFSFLHGNIKTALQAPNSIVLSEALATKLFGTANPVGEQLQLGEADQWQVTGVIKKTGNTHLAKEAYLRQSWPNSGWLSNNFATYVRTSQTADRALLGAKMTSIVKPHLKLAFEAYGYDYNEAQVPNWKLQPIEEVHLYSKDYLGTFVRR